MDNSAILRQLDVLSGQIETLRTQITGGGSNMTAGLAANPGLARILRQHNVSVTDASGRSLAPSEVSDALKAAGVSDTDRIAIKRAIERVSMGLPA